METSYELDLDDERTIEFSLYHRSKRTSVEMMQARGFSVGDDERYLTMNLEDFIDEIGPSEINYDALTGRYEKREDGTHGMLSSQNRGSPGHGVTNRGALSHGVLIKFIQPQERPKTKGVDNFITIFLNELRVMKYDQVTGILVYNQPLTVEMRKTLVKKYPFTVEFFDIKELIVNITNHVYQPVYVTLSKQEQKEFLERNKSATPSRLPKMRDDPTVKFYGWQVGQIVQVTFTSNLSENMDDKSVEHYYIDAPLQTKE